MNSNEKKNDSNFTYDMQDAYYYDDATGSFKKRTDEKTPDAAGEGQHGCGNWSYVKKKYKLNMPF